MTKEQLNKHFVDWFYNQNWVQNYNRNGWMRDHYNNGDPSQRHYWMLEAFMAGYNLEQKLYVEELDRMFDDLEAAEQEQSVHYSTWPFPSNTTTLQITQFATKSGWPF